MAAISEKLQNISTMETQPVTFDHLEPIPMKYGCTGVLLTCVFFQLVNKLVTSIGAPKEIPQKEFWKWRNLFISWFHALIVGTWDLSCFFKCPEMIQDLVTHHCVFSYAMVTFSTGYFFYDFFDIVFNKRIVSMKEVLIHHVAVAGMFFYNVLTCRCIAYNVIALMAEINSFFLHSRKLMQMLKVQFSHWFYRLNAYVNLFTFIICRFFALIWIIYGMVMFHHRVSLFYMCILSPAIFVMAGINVVLFWRLFQNDILRPRRRKTSSPTDNYDICTSNNNIKLNGVVKEKIN